MIEVIEVGTDQVELIDVGVITPGPTGPPGPPGQGVPTGGTTNQVLAKNSNTNYDTKWATPSSGGGGNVSTDIIWDNKGDIAVATGADVASKLGVGIDAQVLTADSTQPTGLKWATPATGGGGSGSITSDPIWDTKGDILVATGPDAAVILPAPNPGRMLLTDPAQPTGLRWAIPYSTVGTDFVWDQKGDLIVGTGADVASRVGVGSDGQVLTADSADPHGLKWATPAAGGGGGVTPYIFVSTKTANYTANANEYIPVNATSAAVTITLPTAPANGTRVAVDVIANPSSNSITINRGGTDVIGNPSGSTQFRTMTIVAQKWRATYNAGCWYEDVRNGYTSAANIPITPTVTLTSTDVQNALQELDGDIQSLPTLTSSNTSKVPVTTALGVTKIDVDSLQASTALTTKGDLYVATANNVVTRLGVGADGQVLTADSVQTPGVKWATPTGGTGSGSVSTDTIWDTKGDLAAATGADAASKLPIGTNNQVLTADSTQATGMKWAAPTSGDLFVHMTSDGAGVLNSTVQVADTGFSISLAASSKYVVDFVIFFTADTGSDIKASLHYPTGATALLSGSGWHTSTAGAYQQFTFDQTNFTWNFGSSANPPTINNIIGHGVVTTVANTGLLEFWYSQLAANATTATIRKAGSYMVAKKVA